MASVHELTPAVGIRRACRALGVARDAVVRERHRLHRAALVGPPAPRRARPRPHLALDPKENARIL